MADHFSIIDEAIMPNEWMQHRHVAEAEAPSVYRSYDTAGGGNKNDLIHQVEAKWTNNTPVTQLVYGTVTRGGKQVTLQARSRGYLSTTHGVHVVTGAAPTTFVMSEVSRAGTGLDAGKGGTLATGTGFASGETRQHATSVPLMPASTGWFRVLPGQTIYARVAVSFVSVFWENTSITGGDSGTESLFISGDTRIDLFATPAIVDPGPRPIPTIVNVTTAQAISSDTVVAKPAGTVAGDQIIAVVCNQWAGNTTQLPNPATGWVFLLDRTGGLNDVHMRIFRKIAGVSEPATYTFDNAFLAEQTVFLITIRNASIYLDEWMAASALRRFFWERDDGHIAPSIERSGQLLIAGSYIAHTPAQAPITQTPPVGMTEIGENPGEASTLSIASMASPPNPTGARAFVASKTPSWTGHSIAFSLLIPGLTPI